MKTTMPYTQVLTRGGFSVRSPADLLDPGGSVVFPDQVADSMLVRGWVEQSATDKQLIRHEEVAMVHDDDHPVRLPSTLDHEKLAEAALGLLALTLHDGRVWKALD